jgi:hypothetical protein
MTRKRTHWLLVVALALLVGLLGLVCPPQGIVQAASVVVITDCTTDTQLQHAISTAPAGTTIVFGCRGDILLSKTLAIATDRLTLLGNGRVTLDGNNSVQVFVVNGVTFTLKSLTISRGSASRGGGLDNEGGTVTISNSTFSSNTASSAGGGIYNENGGTMTISNSSITHNTAPFDGGIGNSGTMIIRNSSISSNTATVDSGGVGNYTGTITIRNSNITRNTASVYGGGIENDDMMTISNSSISSNTASSQGGGIINFGTVSMSNSLISSNTAPLGGGIDDVSTAATLSHSKLINNHLTNCAGVIIDGGHNISSDGSCGF